MGWPRTRCEACRDRKDAYSRRERLRPCRTLHCTGNSPETKPFTKTLEYISVYNSFTRDIKWVPNPKLCNTLNKYSCDALSKAFDRSNEIMAADIFLSSTYSMRFLIECTLSCTEWPGIEQVWNHISIEIQLTINACVRYVAGCPVHTSNELGASLVSHYASHYSWLKAQKIQWQVQSYCQWLCEAFRKASRL